jgi:FKBP-type peptidyl-prolyl cis-trans isomerase
MDQFTPITNDRGLYKKILKEGMGKVPENGCKVLVSYKGVLENGTPFDESGEEGFQFELGKNEALLGWEVGIKTMKKGEKSIFVLRSDYAYGENGYMAIPPRACLIFCIDLIDFQKKAR